MKKISKSKSKSAMSRLTSVLFAKGVSEGSKLVASLLSIIALASLILGIKMLFQTPENFGWLSAGAMSAIFGLMAWAMARKKI